MDTNEIDPISESGYCPSSLGFRFSVLDGAIIVIALVGAAFLRESAADVARLILFVVGHFFLFCNVFRIARRLELIWSAVFILNVGLASGTGRWSLETAMAIQLPLTAALIAIQMRSGYYVGVLCRRLNRRRCEAWEEILAKKKTGGA